MPESDSQLPSIRLAPLLGVNQRTAPNSTPAGEWETLEGLYPDQYGQLARIPGKTLYTTVAGNPAVFNIVQTNDGSGNILVQTSQDLRAYTLDELLGRAIAPNIILTPLTDDETMPQAVLLQIEPNTGTGGSQRGWISGSADGTSTPNTFFGRRLTAMPINESGIVVSQVLTPSTGAGDGISGDATPGSFTVAPGTYRIRAMCTFYTSVGVNIAATFQFGLWNATSSAFQTHNSTGGTGTQPIMSSVARGIASGNTNLQAFIDSTFIVTGGNATFQINHGCSNGSNGLARSFTFGGNTDNFTASVNGSVPQTVYAYVILNKIA